MEAEFETVKADRFMHPTPVHFTDLCRLFLFLIKLFFSFFYRANSLWHPALLAWRLEGR